MVGRVSSVEVVVGVGVRTDQVWCCGREGWDGGGEGAGLSMLSTWAFSGQQYTQEETQAQQGRLARF